MKHVMFLFLMWLLPAFSFAAEIYPEDIGATQYGVSHVYAAERYEDIVPDSTYYPKIRKLLLTRFDHLNQNLEEMFQTPKDRKRFVEEIVKIQETVQSEKPRLLFLGKHRALATDGHHRVRGQVRINELLRRAAKLWPEETRSVLKPAGRIGPDGKFIFSLPLKDYDELGKLPKDAKANDIIRELLKNHAGLWKEPELQALAEKFSGDEVKNISEHDLKRLAGAMGITDGPEGVRFTPIMELEDTPARLLLGKYFDTRDMKDGVAFKDYAEFFAGDEVKAYVSTNPEKFPVLKKFLSTSSVSYGFQEEFLDRALLEIDQILVENPKLSARILSLGIKHPKRIERNIVNAQAAFCEGPGKGTPACKSWIGSLRSDENSVYNRCAVEGGKACGCVMKTLNALLSMP